MTKLNLGAGTNKIKDAVNVDMEESCKADLTFDIRSSFPLSSCLFDEVYLFHTIEHIQKQYHRSLFLEINRVMKEGGTFFLSYPEFAKVCQNWLTNFQGKREFWEATIYGRQSWPGDFHVSAMDSDELKQQLEECGFYDIKFHPEPLEFYNTVVTCIRTVPQRTYEEVLFREVCETREVESV